MTTPNNNDKRLYDTTINLITTLHLQKGTLTKEEMHCLLSLLDLTAVGKPDHGLLDLLKEWKKGTHDAEIDAIIKATLLNIDFSNLGSEKTNIDTIRELLRYNKELKDR